MKTLVRTDQSPLHETILAWARTAARFPVAFRSGLDGAPFRIAAYFVLFYVVMPQLSGPASSYAKYLLTIPLVLCFVLLSATRPINLSSVFPLAPLLLSVLGGVSFAHAIFLAPGTATYSSGLIPLIITAMPLLVANRATQTDSASVTEYLLAIFGLAAVFLVMWELMANLLDWEELQTYYGWLEAPWHIRSIAFVYLMTLSGLLRRTRVLVMSITLIAISLVLRPSSTLVFATLFAIAIIVCHWLRLLRILRVGCLTLVATIILGNLAILESEDFANTVYSIEPLVKRSALNANDNNEFRLGVLSAARAEMSDYSILIGKAFTGDVTIDPLVYLPWVHQDTELTIHSDFVIMIVQGGLIGYGLFAAIFIGVARLCNKAARLAHAAHDRTSETLFDALQIMNVTFVLYISPNPTMQTVQCALPYLMLVPLAIFLARAQPRFAAPERPHTLR